MKETDINKWTTLISDKIGFISGLSIQEVFLLCLNSLSLSESDDYKNQF